MMGRGSPTAARVSPDPLKIIDMIKAQTDAAFSSVHHASTEYVFRCNRRRKDGVSQTQWMFVSHTKAAGTSARRRRRAGRPRRETRAKGSTTHCIAYAEANGYGIELAVFRDIDQARRWLFDDPSSNRWG
jgi:hypothetical protein